MSIIIPAVGNVELTRTCIQAARGRAGCPVEIVLVDNGSKPEHATQLAGLGADVYLHYPGMIGFPAACNRGVEQATAKYLCLLNNDAEIVTESWATRLIDTLEDMGAMLIGPWTDQLDYAPTKPGAPCESEILYFFCVLLRRQTWLDIGPLDEQFGLGNYDDVDYCKRVMDAGGKIVLDPGVYCKHKAHATFDRLPEGMFQALLWTNAEKYFAKYHQNEDEREVA